MFTPNMWFGGLSPLDMIDAGRSKKVEQMVIEQIDENAPPIRQIGFKGSDEI
jgi:hypothetical protein